MYHSRVKFTFVTGGILESRCGFKRAAPLLVEPGTGEARREAFDARCAAIPSTLREYRPARVPFEHDDVTPPLQPAGTFVTAFVTSPSGQWAEIGRASCRERGKIA